MRVILLFLLAVLVAGCLGGNTTTTTTLFPPSTIDYREAIARKDCSSLTDKTSLDICLSATVDSPDACANIESGKVKDNCYYRLAEASKNPDLCRKITGEAAQEGCLYRLQTT